MMALSLVFAASLFCSISFAQFVEFCNTKSCSFFQPKGVVQCGVDVETCAVTGCDQSGTGCHDFTLISAATTTSIQCQADASCGDIDIQCQGGQNMESCTIECNNEYSCYRVDISCSGVDECGITGTLPTGFNKIPSNPTAYIPTLPPTHSPTKEPTVVFTLGQPGIRPSPTHSPTASPSTNPTIAPTSSP